MSSKSKTWHIHLVGLVQGVGFRPLVYNLAQKHKISGEVNNDLDGLHIVFNASKKNAADFYQRILSSPPPLAQITSSTFSTYTKKEFQDFQIVQIKHAVERKLYIAPDFATCKSCSRELIAKGDRRFKYSFITCSECGPRYSIIQTLPYDRQNTVMDHFNICNQCLEEYNNPTDRRYYSQTNSCATCGIQLCLFKSINEVLSSDNDTIIKSIIELWNRGMIIAIKGIGGYIITCDASNFEAISTLRKRKRRPNKPFALMYPNMNSLEVFELSPEEKTELNNSISPILLANKTKYCNIVKSICDEHSRAGIMLPYAPLFQNLLHSFGKEIVATSGNISNSPIIYSDKKALEELFGIVDFVLTHDREIVIPQDDSVVSYSAYFKNKIILRRSRGMAPSYYNQKLEFSDNSILAMGAHLKSTFTLLQHKKTYISQYLGDLESFDAVQNYKKTYHHFKTLLHFKPELIVVDFHPNYHSTLMGNEIAEKYNIRVMEVQHHIAHFSALLGEYGYSDNTKKVLGVVWDGTGLGTDDNLWGGEFFLYHNFQFERVEHLPYFPHYAHDKMAKEPRLSALSLCYQHDESRELLKSKFNKTEWNIYTSILKKKGHKMTSSMGRLFDGVASLLGLVDIQSYEGHAASLLQAKAEEHFNKYGINYNYSYFEFENCSKSFTNSLLKNIVRDVKIELDASIIAAKFHLTLVYWIKQVATMQGVKKIGFSGGVFQNSLLVDLIILHLKDQYELLFHKDLSPNDENISFGQLIYSDIICKRI